MKYGSVCSGIEAATTAWHPLGWEPVFFSEIEPFPSAVLQHHYPHVPNLGDMTKFKEWPDATINVLVGGTPCQSFSVAGLRKGLDDPRGNLMLTFGAIAEQYSPRWLVWENVPGVLSSNEGRDFGAFLGMLGQLGYGFAYRVLDAQYFGVAQRRRRVFVVGYLGDWRRAAGVLFERDSLCGNTPPRREKREEATSGFAIGIDKECNAGIEHFGPLLRGGQGGTRQAVAFSMITANTGANGLGVSKEIAATLDRAQPCAIAFGVGESPDVAHCLRSGASKADKHESTTYVVNAEPVAFAQNTRDEVREMVIVGALAAQPGMKQTSYIREGMQVRRLTPTECERLQGFPDGYTKVSDKTPNGVRYKALGNSMAVPVMKWIGERIGLCANLRI